MSALTQYHQEGIPARSRNQKIAPLSDIQNVQANRVGTGLNVISWGAVPGANRYEVFYRVNSLPQVSTTGLGTLANVNINTRFLYERVMLKYAATVNR